MLQWAASLHSAQPSEKKVRAVVDSVLTLTLLTLTLLTLTLLTLTLTLTLTQVRLLVPGALPLSTAVLRAPSNPQV